MTFVFLFSLRYCRRVFDFLGVLFALKSRLFFEALSLKGAGLLGYCFRLHGFPFKFIFVLLRWYFSWNVPFLAYFFFPPCVISVRGKTSDSFSLFLRFS